MIRKKAVLRGVIYLLLAAVIGLVLLYRGIRTGAMPYYEGVTEIRGLTDSVEIWFDVRGMPHIYAENEHDLYFATGWIMARERLWQMDLIRRATRGTLSEIFGEEFVDTDLFLRSLSMTGKSRKVLTDSPPGVILVLQHFCDGVNRYINDAGRRLPPEFRLLGYRPQHWSLEDVANIIGYMGWDLASSNLSEAIFNYRLHESFGEEGARALIPDWEMSPYYVFPEGDIDAGLLDATESLTSGLKRLEELGIVAFSGSNNWAVDGSRSESGKPLLANDMHLGLSSPGIWMQIHQVIPGKLNVTGVAVPGQPFVISGHNEKIAWGLTNVMADDIDLFRETTDGDKPGKYLFNGEWLEMTVREELIEVKGGEVVERELHFTHRGPVVSAMRGIDDAVLTMRWSGFDHSDEILAVYKLNRADNFDQFRDAISHFRAISQNFVYADIYGNIGLNTGGGIPLREGPGTMIREGSTDRYDWTGYLPFSELPSIYNPPGGAVSSANNRCVGDHFEWYIATSYAMPYRINRIRELLDARERHSVESFNQIINDQVSVYARLLAPAFVNAVSEAGDLSPSESEGVRLLQEWDYDMDSDSEAAALFELSRSALGEELLRDRLGELYRTIPGAYRDYYIYRELKKVHDADWQDDDSFGTPLVIALERAFRRGVSRMGEITAARDAANLVWGDLLTLTLEHPMGSVRAIDLLFRFNSPTYRAGGSYHTVSPYSYGSGFKVTDGASQRHIYDIADWDNSYTIIPTGNSGVPGSPYYLSQTEKYLEGGIYSDHFSRSAVVSNAASRLLLTPYR